MLVDPLCLKRHTFMGRLHSHFSVFFPDTYAEGVTELRVLPWPSLLP